MKYENNFNLLADLNNDIPEHANLIYKKIFNQAYLKYKNRHKPRNDIYRGEYAHKMELSLLKPKHKRTNIDKWKNIDIIGNDKSFYAV